MRQKPKQYNMRLQEHHVEWVDEYASSKGSTRTEITEELYVALAEGRLYVAPRPGPNPFPAQEPLFPEPPGKE